MSDTIYRQAAIEAVEELIEIHFDRAVILNKVVVALMNIPSAQPERKRGRWIPHEDEDGEHYGDKCSECGEWYVMPFGKTSFCPNCGADMRGVEV